MGKDLNHCMAGCESFEKITLKPGWHQRPLICFPNILICHYLDGVDLIPDFFYFFFGRSAFVCILCSLTHNLGYYSRFLYCELFFNFVYYL